MARQAVDRPHAVNRVGEAMRMVATDPAMVVAPLQDGPDQDPLAARRAKAVATQGRRNVAVRVARSPPLPHAFDPRVIPSEGTLGENRRDDDPVRDMATAPDNCDRNAIGGCPLDNPPCAQAPQ
jgi:hypothetical protein